MAFDPYSPCPCGSGKNFKFCCHAIFEDIERAFEQAEQGQEVAAFRIIDEVVAKHPKNAESWGRKAQLLLMYGKVDEGEELLQKAFDLNPNYPWGLLLQARLRMQEGEITGAVLLARRAADAYDPRALDHLSQAYGLIFDCEMQRNRPVAAHAALRIVVKCRPADKELQEVLEKTFGAESHLPQSARKQYQLRPAASGVAGERRRAWDQALAHIDSPRLSNLAVAFDKLTQDDPGDSPAWFNLGLCQAWLGENRKAIEALDRSIEREADDAKGAEATALCEVLRCGQGLEDDAEMHEYVAEYECREFQPLGELLNEWHRDGRMIAQPTQDQSVVAAMLFEPLNASIVTTASTPTQERRGSGYLVLSGNQLRVWGPLQEALDRVREEIKTRAQLTVSEKPLQRRFINFGDVLAEATLFPFGTNPETAKNRVAEYATGYFEERWIHQPLRTLAGNTPLDAVGHATLRKKVLGKIQFFQDCAGNGILKDFDFDRVRRKLGLLTASAPAAGQPADVSAMSAAELSALDVSQLSDQQLEQAYSAAIKLGAEELPGHFARTLVARPIDAGRNDVDRFPFYVHLLHRAFKDGDNNTALDLVNDGQRVDCEHNEGRRRNDYELRRGQVHVKRGEADQAHDVFTRLIERTPDHLKLRGAAAEGMLTLKQADRALQFAEAGLAEARKKQDRDSEQYLMELVAAAKRQGGSG